MMTIRNKTKCRSFFFLLKIYSPFFIEPGYVSVQSFTRYNVVLDEGNDLGVKYAISNGKCEAFCNKTSGCNSFVHCMNSDDGTGDCWLKDKLLRGNEQTRDDTHGNRCTTYYFPIQGIYDYL